MFPPSDFFDLESIPHKELFQVKNVWQILGQTLREYMDHLNSKDIFGKIQDGAFLLSEKIHIGKNSLVEAGAVIKGPVWIGENCIIRSHAYVREYTIVMDGAIVGHATETKGSILFPGAQASHFNYVGDSILGQNVNLGAGTILSNLKNINESIVLKINNQTYDTGLRKFGAILGDGTKTGCNSVFNPGCMIGKNSIIYPLASVKKGYYPKQSLIKLRQSQEMSTVNL